MKHEFKQEGFDHTKLLKAENDMEYNAIVYRMWKLINVDPKFVTITYRNKPEDTCPVCQYKEDYKVYNHMGWEWPSTLIHMIKNHDMLPSIEFRKDVLGI
jgi:hypothetical protein